jgi:hypothetical protein
MLIALIFDFQLHTPINNFRILTRCEIVNRVDKVHIFIQTLSCGSHAYVHYVDLGDGTATMEADGRCGNQIRVHWVVGGWGGGLASTQALTRTSPHTPHTRDVGLSVEARGGQSTIIPRKPLCMPTAPSSGCRRMRMIRSDTDV